MPRDKASRGITTLDYKAPKRHYAAAEGNQPSIRPSDKPEGYDTYFAMGPAERAADYALGAATRGRAAVRKQEGDIKAHARYRMKKRMRSVQFSKEK